MSTNRLSLPVDLGGGCEPTDANLEKAYQHTEKGVPRGFFPLGSNGVWHGGVHLYGAENTPVLAMFDGEVVAARLVGDAQAAIGDFGSLNFIVVAHEVRGSVLNSAAGGSGLSASKLYRFFSIYMHLAPLEIDKGNAKLGAVGWLARPYAEGLSASVGSGGSNRKADVELVQKMLTRAGVDPGPIDGLIGSKTINGIRVFQDRYLFTNPDGRIDVGGLSWAALRYASLGTPKDDGFDEPLLARLKQGQVVNPRKSVGAGQQLWAVGAESKKKKAWLVQWEVISEEHLFKSFTEVVDPAPFTADGRKILELVKGQGWIPGNGPIGSAQVATFYASSPGVAKARQLAVKFRSEWAADPDAMIAAMQGQFLTEGLHAQVAPYVWYPQAQAEAELPGPSHYHYNPISVIKALRDAEFRRTLPPPPPPPAPPAGGGGGGDSPGSAPGPAASATGDKVVLFDPATRTVYQIDAKVYELFVAADDATRVVMDNVRVKYTATISANKNAAAISADAKAAANELKELVKPSEAPNVDLVGFKEFWAIVKNGGKRPLYIAPAQLKRPPAAVARWNTKAQAWANKTGQVARPLQNYLNKKAPLKDAVKFADKWKQNPQKQKPTKAEFEWESTWFENSATLTDFFDSCPPDLLTFMGEKKGANWSAAGEAAFLRLSCAAKATATFDPNQGKAEVKAKLGGSFDLVSGHAKAEWYPICGIDGWRIPMANAATTIGLRFKFFGSVGAFVGATAELTLGASVAWKEQAGDDNYVGPKLSGGFEGFAGAKAEGKLGMAIEWQEPGSSAWVMVGEFTGSLMAAAGIGATFMINIEYKNGQFICFAKAEVVVKVGLGTSVGFKINVQAALNLLVALLKAVNWGMIAEFTLAAFSALSDIMVGSAIRGVQWVVDLHANVVSSILSSLASWWNTQSRIGDLATNINTGKARLLLEKGTPEAKGDALYHLTQASWAAGVEETAEEAAIKLLRSSKSKVEAAKILKSVDPKGIARPGDGVSAGQRAAARKVKRGYDLISGLVDWGEQTDLDNFMKQMGFMDGSGKVKEP